MATKSTSKTRQRERSKSRLKQNRLGDTSTEAPKKKSTSKTRERERTKSRESQRGVTRTKEARRRKDLLKKLPKMQPMEPARPQPGKPMQPAKPDPSKPMPPGKPKPGKTLPPGKPKPGKQTIEDRLKNILPKLKEQRKLRPFSKGGKVTKSNNKGKKYI